MAEDTAAQVYDAPQDDGWYASSLWRRPVVNVRTVEQLGEVADIIFDAESRQIVGLLVQAERRQGTMLEAAHRALAGATRFTAVDAAHVIALDDEIVTIDPERAAPAAPRPLDALPHLGRVRGFAVLTLEGKRLGRFVDLRVDRTGRRILGFMVQPGSHGSGRGASSLRPERLQAPPDAPTQPEPALVQPPAASAATASPALVTVPAACEVRVGRDLIIVVDATSIEWREHPLTSAQFSSNALAATSEQDEAPIVPDDSPTWFPPESDASTEPIRH